MVHAQVEFTADKRAVRVTTKDTAPGGRRTEKVGLPYDPDLFDHMVAHGVAIEASAPLPPSQRFRVLVPHHCENRRQERWDGWREFRCKNPDL